MTTPPPPRRIAGSPNWEGTGKSFCLREDLRQELRRFRGVRLLGFWALGRHAVPSICTRKTIGRVFPKDHPIFRTCCAG
eukprot:scaffold4548_cov107-Isochrysis_galbana.AAC.8